MPEDRKPEYGKNPKNHSSRSRRKNVPIKMEKQLL